MNPNLTSNLSDRRAAAATAGGNLPRAMVDRHLLQTLNELLGHYDLSRDSTTDNSDLSAKLRAVLPTDL